MMTKQDCIDYCIHCYWPVAPEGVTLTDLDAEPLDGAKQHRCNDTACVVAHDPSAATVRVNTRRAIIVLSDGETWERLSGDAYIVVTTPAEYEALLQGEKPKHVAFQEPKLPVLPCR